MKLWSIAITGCRHFSSKAAGKTNFWIRAANRPKKVRSPKTNWTDEQHRVLDAISNGKSVFVTGSAGTGKTFLLEEIIKKLKTIHGKSTVYVTASTGAAACALHGQTLHSFAGVGYGELDGEGLLERVLSDQRACRRWRKVKALVIDETSMVDANLFDGLAYVARSLRRDEGSVSGNETWGGIQLVVSGDFFQLSPITGTGRKKEKKTTKTKTKKRKKEKEDVKVYAFEAECWGSSFDLQIELTRVFRQSDALLVHLLQGIRRAEVDPDDLNLLVECCSVSEPDPAAVRLFPRISDVDEVNREKLKELDEEIHVYIAADSGEKQWMKQLHIGMARESLEICVGSRVMLIKNISPWRKLVNGATGTVSGFCRVGENGDLLPLVKFDSGSELIVEPETWEVRDGDEVVARRRQIPLILSWALSIHKCQGMSLDKLHTDLSRVFGHGMVYVALSRVRSLAGLGLSGLDASKITAHPKVLEFYRSFGESGEEKVSDVVIGKKKPA